MRNGKDFNLTHTWWDMASHCAEVWEVGTALPSTPTWSSLLTPECFPPSPGTSVSSLVSHFAINTIQAVSIKGKS